MLRKVILVWMLFLGLLNATNVTTNKAKYTPNESIKITFTEMSGDNKDWIAIYPKGSSTDWANVIQWDWAGAVNGNHTFEALPLGDYEVRAFFNNSYKLEANKIFSVRDRNVNEVVLTMSKENYAPNEAPVLKFSNMTGTNSDWIAIYPAGSENTWANMIQWERKKSVNGNHTFNALPEGNYEARAFFNNSFNLEASIAFSVGDGNENGNQVVLTMSKENYAPNETPILKFSNMTGTNSDWIAIYPAGSENTWANMIQWERKKSVNGTHTFNALPAGNYEARAFFNNSFNVEASIAFSVGDINVYSAISKRMDDAMNEVNNNVVYIVTGDSTRHNNFNKMIEYYTTQLDKANITVYNNAESGQRGELWKNNIRISTIEKALAQTEGDGENTILEYSFGINDFSHGTEAEVKQWLKEGLVSYMQAKPKSLVFLVVPTATTTTNRVQSLKKTYKELSIELNLPLVDALIPTMPLVRNPTYYRDSVHPNAKGSKIIVDYILGEVSSQALKNRLGL